MLDILGLEDLAALVACDSEWVSRAFLPFSVGRTEGVEDEEGAPPDARPITPTSATHGSGHVEVIARGTVRECRFSGYNTLR